LPAKLRVDEEPLEFDSSWSVGAQSDTAAGGEKDALVLSREISEFLLKGLEAEVDVDVSLVVAKEALDMSFVLRELGWTNVKLRDPWVQTPKIPFKS
jgi:hypothetical protein